MPMGHYPRGKLTAEQVAHIKRLRRDKYADWSRERASIAIAKRLPVSRYTVRSILAGKNWTHVNP